MNDFNRKNFDKLSPVQQGLLRDINKISGFPLWQYGWRRYPYPIVHAGPMQLVLEVPNGPQEGDPFGYPYNTGSVIQNFIDLHKLGAFASYTEGKLEIPNASDLGITGNVSGVTHFDMAWELQQRSIGKPHNELRAEYGLYAQTLWDEHDELSQTLRQHIEANIEFFPLAPTESEIDTFIDEAAQQSKFNIWRTLAHLQNIHFAEITIAAENPEQLAEHVNRLREITGDLQCMFSTVLRQSDPLKILRAPRGPYEFGNEALQDDRLWDEHCGLLHYIDPSGDPKTIISHIDDMIPKFHTIEALVGEQIDLERSDIDVVREAATNRLRIIGELVPALKPVICEKHALAPMRQGQLRRPPLWGANY